MSWLGAIDDALGDTWFAIELALHLGMVACGRTLRFSSQTDQESAVPTPPEKEAAESSPNAAIIAEVNRAGSWFHAKDVRPIRARKLEVSQTVETLEGPVEAKAGDYLCRGEAGEPWPQSAKSLHERYVETDDIDAEGWRRYLPRPDAEDVLAAKIDHSFTVQATWGPLSGKAGDYLVKKFADRDMAQSVDVWIIDAALNG